MASLKLTRRTLLAAAAVVTATTVSPIEIFAASDETIRPFAIDVPQTALDDLRRRLLETRWPDAELVDDQSQGAQLEKVRALVEYWVTKYDWRKIEARINSYPQFVTNIDGVDIHFLHIKSKHAAAKPLLITHGWPGSIVELLNIIEPLTDPTTHGGNAEDAFHLVLPSIPGYGFSGKPRELGWNRHRVAKAWSSLMLRLGYKQYLAQGGDWGAVITQAMGQRNVPGLVGLHINMPAVVPSQIPATLTPEEQKALDSLKAFFTQGGGYAMIQGTRPQTIGYALADSPVGQAAWIYEKLAAWSDSDGKPESIFSMDQMLDAIMFYWITNSATSSARFYYENSDIQFGAVDITLPVGVTVFPKEIYQAPKSWAEKTYHNLVYFNKAERGGHFAAFEQPELFTKEVRAAFRQMPVSGAL